jgi:RNA polymerase sigma-70 factor (ECF subfamily)
MISDTKTVAPMAEQDLWAGTMARVAERDEAALARLFDGTSKAVYGFALQLVKDSALAEDIMMEVFLQVWRTAETYDPQRGSVLAWIITLARSRTIDSLRARKSRRANHQQDLSDVALFDTRPSPEHAAMWAGCALLVRSAIATLCPDQKQAIELAYFSGFSHHEIATRSGVPLGTVKTRIRMGRLKLRELLEPFAKAL